jgi:hypothetical protein
MYWGFDKDGINREVASTIECAALCRDNKCKSLAVPETVLLNTAMLLCQGSEGKASSTSMLGFDALKVEHPSSRPPEATIIAGILPSLRYIMERDKLAVNSVLLDRTDPVYNGVKLTIARKPDTYHDPLVYPTDPYGSDYFCMICNQELSNSYFHCNGCEVILNRDFNICSQCYGEGLYLKKIQIHPTSNKWYSDVNHMGETTRSSLSRSCPCHAGRCRACPDGFCKSCSCNCHKAFINQFRFIDEETTGKMLELCENIAAGLEVQYSRETKDRLHRKPFSTDA